MDEAHPNLCPWINNDQCLNWFAEQLMQEYQKQCSTRGFLNSPTLPNSLLLLERPVHVGVSFN